MNSKKSIRAVIFDMNGMIVDDEQVHEIAFRDVLSPYGIDLNHEEYMQYFAGKTDRDGFISIGKAYNIELPLEKVLSQKKEAYLRVFPKDGRPYSGVADLINKLAKHYILALVSSSSREEVNLILREFQLEPYFRVTISADDVSKGKPEPEPYSKAAIILQVRPTECAVIEDSKSGIKSAKLAGMHCIGITTTHTRNDLEEADIIVDDFSQISSELIERIKNS